MEYALFNYHTITVNPIKGAKLVEFNLKEDEEKYIERVIKVHEEGIHTHTLAQIVGDCYLFAFLQMCCVINDLYDKLTDDFKTLIHAVGGPKYKEDLSLITSSTLNKNVIDAFNRIFQGYNQAYHTVKEDVEKGYSDAFFTFAFEMNSNIQTKKIDLGTLQRENMSSSITDTIQKYPCIGGIVSFDNTQVSSTDKSWDHEISFKKPKRIITWYDTDTTLNEFMHTNVTRLEDINLFQEEEPGMNLLKADVKITLVLQS